MKPLGSFFNEIYRITFLCLSLFIEICDDLFYIDDLFIIRNIKVSPIHTDLYNVILLRTSIVKKSSAKDSLLILLNQPIC